MSLWQGNSFILYASGHIQFPLYVFFKGCIVKIAF